MDVVEVLTERLKYLMEHHRIRAAPLARSANLNESAVRDILRGRSKNPGIVTLQKIASVLHLRPSALFEAGALWPVVGAVSDGAASMFASDDARIGLMVENPFFMQMPGDLTALLVEDDSLAPFAYAGDHLVIGASEALAESFDAGRPRCCKLDDGRTLIRFVRPGKSPESVTLLPVNPYATPVSDVRIVSDQPVLMTLPAWFSTTTKEPTHVSSDAVHEEQAVFKPKRRRAAR